MHERVTYPTCGLVRRFPAKNEKLVYAYQSVIFTIILCLNHVFGQNLGRLRCYDGLKVGQGALTVSCIVTVSVPTLCRCNRWPDYGDFLADGYLWVLPMGFPHVSVAQTLQKMPQSGGRGHPSEKKGVIFGRFWRGWPTLGSILGAQTVCD